MVHKIIKAGRSSLAVIIPAKFVHFLGIKAGDKVKISSHVESGTLSVKFSGALQLKLPTHKHFLSKET
jgi:antitoxin component of MazEF toxin-antitoxin module